MRAQVYWIEGVWPGRMAIVPRPRGGDWLTDEARAWAQAGLDVIVSLLTSDEAADLDLRQEAEACQAAGLSFISFPVVDRSVPSSRAEARRLVEELSRLLAEGRNIGLHCRQGIGRSALIAAALLVQAGVEPEAAFQKISAARGCAVPETTEQREWVEAFARELMALTH